MYPFPSFEELRELIHLAKREDLGPKNDDVTSRLMVPENAVEPHFTGAVLRPDPPVQRELVAFTRADPPPLVEAFTDVLAEHAVIDPRRPSILPGRQRGGRAA